MDEIVTIQSSKAFVLEQARKNIERVVENPGYVEQAKQVNASLASIVAMERNAVMHEAIQLSRKGSRFINDGN